MAPMQPAEPPTIKLDPKAPSHVKLMQGLNQGGVAILAPDGSLGLSITYCEVFLGAESDFRPGVVMTAADARRGWCPEMKLTSF